MAYTHLLLYCGQAGLPALMMKFRMYVSWCIMYALIDSHKKKTVHYVRDMPLITMSLLVSG